MERDSATNQSAISDAESVNLLNCLGLTEDQIAALRQQGFVARERRHGRSEVFKLRFRINGQQQVRYLGTSPLEATRVALALKALQKAKRLRREMQRLQRESQAVLKATKKLLGPALEAAGFRFHGLSVRYGRG